MNTPLIRLSLDRCDTYRAQLRALTRAQSSHDRFSPYVPLALICNEDVQTKNITPFLIDEMIHVLLLFRA